MLGFPEDDDLSMLYAMRGTLEATLMGLIA